MFLFSFSFMSFNYIIQNYQNQILTIHKIEHQLSKCIIILFCKNMNPMKILFKKKSN
jgi:hypothetical protein